MVTRVSSHQPVIQVQFAHVLWTFCYKNEVFDSMSHVPLANNIKSEDRHHLKGTQGETGSKPSDSWPVVSTGFFWLLQSTHLSPESKG